MVSQQYIGSAEDENLLAPTPLDDNANGGRIYYDSETTVNFSFIHSHFFVCY
jgi:hypothetical protein